MAAFHRFTQPVYAGAPSIPAGPGTTSFNGVPYSFINVVSGGVGASGSAFADGAKGSGPNTGTKFVAFGEDATSSNANRGLRALAENTDYLDDVVNKALAVPVRTATATASGTVFSIALPALTFVGNSGGYALDELFSVVDQNDNELMTTAGTKISVVSISGATVGDGFSTGAVTLTVNPGIPNGTQYRVYYGARASLATLSVDTFTFIRVRGAQEVSATVENVFRTMQGPPAAALAWNATPQSTLWDLAASGLNGRYRRATTTTGTVNFNTPGDGAVITRDGQAVTSASRATFSDHTQPDPFMALWLATDEGQGGARAGANSGLGSMGFVAKTNRPYLQGEISTNSNNRGVSLGGFGEFIERQQVVVAGSPGVGNGYVTKIPKGTAATIGPMGGGQTDVFQITLSAGSFFKKTVSGAEQTAVQVGRDVLLVTIGSATVAMLITRMDQVGDDLAVVTTLDGGTVPALASAAAGTVACTVTWCSVRFSVGFNAADVKNSLDALSGHSTNTDIPTNGGVYIADVPTGLASDVTDSSGSWKVRRNPQPTLSVRRYVRPTLPKEVVMQWGELQGGASDPTAGGGGNFYSDGSIGAHGFITEDSSPTAIVPRNYGYGRISRYAEIGGPGPGPGLLRANRYGLLHATGSKRVIIPVASTASSTLDWAASTVDIADTSITSSGGQSIPQSIYVAYNATSGTDFIHSPTILMPWHYGLNIGDELQLVIVARNCRVQPQFWDGTLLYPKNRQIVTGGVTTTVCMYGVGQVGKSSAASPNFIGDYMIATIGVAGTAQKCAATVYRFRLLYVGGTASVQQVTWGCVFCDIITTSDNGVLASQLITDLGVETAPHP